MNNTNLKKRKIRQTVSGVIFVSVLGIGWVFPWVGLFVPACMLLGVGIAMFHGRKWCDWLCPRGSFYDAFVSYISPGGSIPPLLRTVWFRFAVMGVLMLIIGANVFLLWPSPYRLARLAIAMLSTTTIIGFILALFTHPRAWCHVCPVGTISSLFSRGKPNMKIETAACVSCKVCSKKCPMSINPDSYAVQGEISHPDCIKCGVCSAACPKNAIHH